MSKKKYTKEEKNKYFEELRNKWEKSKKLAEKDDITQALYREAGIDVSYNSFAMTLYEMQAAGLDGIPYVDCKTYKKWQESGYIVKKGQSSIIRGITWIKSKTEDGEEDDGFVYPKVYSLFHKSQVEALKV